MYLDLQVSNFLTPFISPITFKTLILGYKDGVVGNIFINAMSQAALKATASTHSQPSNKSLRHRAGCSQFNPGVDPATLTDLSHNDICESYYSIC